MSDLRYTDTNAADDSAGRVFGLEGNLYLPVVGGFVAGVLLFAGLGFVGTGYPLAGIVAGIPITGSLVWVLGFRQGKPSGYDRDRLDQALGGANFTRSSEPKTHTKSHADAPEGRLIEGMLVFGSPERGGVVAKGFRLEPPDLRGASFEQLNAFQDRVRALLALVSPGRRLQIQWWPDSDYRQALLAYHSRTQEVSDPTIRAVRNERFTRYWPRTLDGSLRREHLAAFLSIEVDAYAGNVRGHDGLQHHYAGLRLPAALPEPQPCPAHGGGGGRVVRSHAYPARELLARRRRRPKRRRVLPRWALPRGARP